MNYIRPNLFYIVLNPLYSGSSPLFLSWAARKETMRVNNSTIAPFVDQKSMVWEQQTFVEHSKYASAIANLITKKGKKKKKN